MDLGKLLEALVNRGKLLRRIMYVVLAGLVIADIVIPSAYDRFPWESIGGFGAFYGFVSCVLIIVVSKALGYLALYRNEDYYENDGRSAGESGGGLGGERGGTTTFDAGADQRSGGRS
jgi:hypothetical protein